MFIFIFCFVGFQGQREDFQGWEREWEWAANVQSQESIESLKSFRRLYLLVSINKSIHGIALREENGSRLKES